MSGKHVLASVVCMLICVRVCVFMKGIRFSFFLDHSCCLFERFNCLSNFVYN